MQKDAMTDFAVLVSVGFGDLEGGVHSSISFRLTFLNKHSISINN